jgi:hypothetical protein
VAWGSGNWGQYRMSSIPAVQWFARADRTLGSQPEAMEVAVEVSGARAAGPSGARELFSEPTTTTLVFEDGAVVRLSAPVVVGQLVFLRHQQTQKEIVTRVLRQRSFGTATAYVELEFSEAAPGFWGAAEHSTNAFDRAPVAAGIESKAPNDDTYVLDLPDEVATATSQSTHPQDAAASSPIHSQVAAHSGSLALALVSAHVPPVAPDAEEVARLREELAGLRMQMSSMAQSADASRSADTGSSSDGETHGATSIATKMLKSRLPKGDPSTEGAGEEEFSEGGAGVLPAGAEVLPPGSVKVRAGLIAALLILGLVAASAYFEGFLADWYAKRSVIAAGVGTTGPARTVAKSAPRTASTATTTNGTSPVAATSGHSTTDRSVSANGSEESRGAVESAASTSVEQPRPTDATRDTAGGDDGSHLEKVLSNSNNHPVTVTAVAEESYEPPSLIKAVNAVPPPDAIRGFVTGDVKFEALIDTAGKVSSATVISGPAALRAAAQEALRHYEFKPASKNGQSVAARVPVTVKFWYEP